MNIHDQVDEHREKLRKLGKEIVRFKVTMQDLEHERIRLQEEIEALKTEQRAQEAIEHFGDRLNLLLD